MELVSGGGYSYAVPATEKETEELRLLLNKKIILKNEGARDKPDTYMTEFEYCFGLRDWVLWLIEEMWAVGEKQKDLIV